MTIDVIDKWARELLAAQYRGDGRKAKAIRIAHKSLTEEDNRALRAIAAALTSHWLPISTAPKDGTGILLSNGKDVAEGHWYFEEGGTTEYRDLDGRYIGQTDSDGYAGWLDWDGGMQPDPTHWQPLPVAPEVV
ncbi:hypothetical protein A7X84_13860 [Stenotrophomonas maltophilia]|uniref:DUF551 domain-containing protein n=1 Tax=Stenotrophomonas TaxID=40323 RepID=UPI000DA94BF4|nr:DUF551 domain-containing protein [Stenotrophomonas maltophilia]PZS80629.1 hypothetical protein A7X84_13860 [Stenotrophomonas maltophilia]PZT13318.1 hypothetical protein A7X82_15180 [Stenotrophomonas maltophilia]